MIELYEGVPGSGKSITRSVKSSSRGSDKDDDSISRWMEFIWIGWRCSQASSWTALEQQITIWKDSVGSPPGLSTCRTRLGGHYRRGPNRLSVDAEG